MPILRKQFSLVHLQIDYMSYVQQYHNLDVPLNPDPFDGVYSPLQLLYPGRPMPVSSDIDWYNISPEDPVGARETFLNGRKETEQYAELLEAETRRMGGGDANKIPIFPTADPSQVNEDPDLKFVSFVGPTSDSLAALPQPVTTTPVIEGFSDAPASHSGKDTGNDRYFTVFMLALFMFFAAVLLLAFLKR